MKNKFCIKELEIELWEKAYEDQVKVAAKAKETVFKDPLSQLIDLNIEFSDMLKKNVGKQRQEKSFNDKIKKMAIKEKRLKKLSKDFDILKASDDYSMQEIKLGYIATKLANIKFQNKRF